MTQTTTVAVLCLLVLASVAAGVSLAETRTTIDADHALDTDAKQGDFAQNGHATATLTAPDMSITVAAEHDADGCGLEGFHSDIRNDYLCVQYNEEIDRSVRLYIPAEYWTPYLREDVAAAAGDAHAAFEPIQDATYTKVTFTVTEPGTYAWKINSEASLFAGAKERTLENIQDVTGVGVPNTTTWSYIQPSQLGGNESAYVVRAPNGTDRLVMEYETASGEWAQVPDEPKGYAPVYYETKQGVNDRVYVFAMTENATTVRYKTEAGPTSQIGAALRQIGQIPNRIEELLNIDLPFIGG